MHGWCCPWGLILHLQNVKAHGAVADRLHRGGKVTASLVPLLPENNLELICSLRHAMGHPFFETVLLSLILVLEFLYCWYKYEKEFKLFLLCEVFKLLFTAATSYCAIRLNFLAVFVTINLKKLALGTPLVRCHQWCSQTGCALEMQGYT